jgi:hypothetical protein
MDPASPEILYLGFGDPWDTQQPGITYSRDGGASWADPVLLQATLTVGNAAHTFLAQSVRALLVDPQASEHVLAGTDVGLFQSRDAGGSWQPVVLPGPAGEAAASIWSIAWAGGSTFLVAGQIFQALADVDGANRTGRDTASPLGLWRSDDAGAHWTDVRAGVPGADGIARATLAVAPGTTADGATSRVFLLASARVDDIADSAQRDVLRSEDGGRTFTGLGVNAAGHPVNPTARQPDLDVLSYQAWYNQAIAVDPLDENIVYVGGAETSVRSTDGGASWSVMTEGYAVYNDANLASVHPDFHALLAVAYPDPQDSSTLRRALYAGNDGGLYRSDDAHTAAVGRVTFSDALNEGLVTHQAYDVACADDSWPASLQGFIAGGTQDNGTRLREGSTTIFDEVLGGDGVGVAVSRDLAQVPGVVGPVPRAVLASTASGGPRIYRSTDGGQSFGAFNAGIGGNIPFFVRFARDADGATFLTYTNTPDHGVYAARGDSWQRVPGRVRRPDGGVGDFLTPEGKPSLLHAIGAHPTRSGVWGVVGDSGTVYWTHDAGQTFTMAGAVLGTDATRPVGVKGTSSIAFPPDYDPKDPATQTLYASSIATVLYDGSTPVPAGFGHAFKTSDGGRSWQPLLGSGTQTLPDVPVQRVRVDPGDPQTIYVATDVGLYRSIDGGATFDRLGNGLPLVRVSELCFSGGSLSVATYGRGFWQLSTLASADPAGVRGSGDTNHDLRIDGLDLLDLAAALGSTEADASYRAEADLVGTANRIDDADLSALLTRFGGAP